MNSGVSGYSLENLGAELMCIDANATVCFGEDATVKKCKTTSKLTFLNWSLIQYPDDAMKTKCVLIQSNVNL